MFYLETVRDAFSNWSSGNGSILDLMPPDGIVVIAGTAPHCGTFSKKQFVTDVAAPFMQRFGQPPRPHPIKMWEKGSDVVVLADAEGTTLDGKLYANRYVFVLEFQNNRLMKATEFLDMAAFNIVWDSVELSS